MSDAGRTPGPLKIVVHGRSRVLEVAFDAARTFRLPFELMRVYSPSAEVKGHGPGQEVLQIGKKDVTISQLEPVGHYGVKPIFSDGHETGIYSWEYLLWLGENQERLWTEYLQRIEAAGATREAPAPMRSIPIKRL